MSLGVWLWDLNKSWDSAMTWLIIFNLNSPQPQVCNLTVSNSKVWGVRVRFKKCLWTLRKQPTAKFIKNLSYFCYFVLIIPDQVRLSKKRSVLNWTRGCFMSYNLFVNMPLVAPTLQLNNQERTKSPFYTACTRWDCCALPVCIKVMKVEWWVIVVPNQGLYKRSEPEQGSRTGQGYKQD